MTGRGQKTEDGRGKTARGARYLLFFLPFFVLSLPFSVLCKPKVVVSFSILTDFVKTIGGDAIDVYAIVGPDSDPHVFQPTPQTAQDIATADLVIMNGLGFEGWIERLLEAAHFRGPTVVVSKGVKVRYHAATPDPHAWGDARNALLYVRAIEGGLTKLLPLHAAQFRKNAARFSKNLKQLDRWIRCEISKIPLQKRTAVTAHDAFGYFGAAYGMTFLAPQGVSTDSEPSAKELSALVRNIQEGDLRVIFLEKSASEQLIRQLSEETGARVSGPLYSDALSTQDGPASTYINLMRHNVRVLQEAMDNPVEDAPSEAH